MKGDKAGAVLAGGAVGGGPALSKFFGVSRKALLSGRFISKQVGETALGVQFTKQGGLMIADVVGAYGEKAQGVSTTIGALYKNIIAFAKQEGAKEVRINAVGVVNPKLKQKPIDRGFQSTTVWIQDGGEVEALANTFKIK